ncbi:ribonuclease H-like domain-containing protein [Artemisia annua]|uniref:Ribonuclease H-like domain-containing protein n=1 Tax=Artemisia annua TaxID=35608 RepID=A0A2U1QCQ8_ARTAN|nr:ribonuclease H-like domain-containing protein [Artemisia annua]
MTHELQKKMYDRTTYDMVNELKAMFQTHAIQELFMQLNACKIYEGQSLSSHVLKMKRYINKLELLGHHMPHVLAVNTIMDTGKRNFPSYFVELKNVKQDEASNKLGLFMIELFAVAPNFSDTGKRNFPSYFVELKNGKQDEASNKLGLFMIELFAVAPNFSLCVGRNCVIFKIMHAPFIPDSLVNFLSNPSYTFVGVGVENDVQKLCGDYGIEVGRIEDIRDLAFEKFDAKELRNAGLKGLTHWVAYACVDAYLSFEIGRSLIYGD